MLKQFSILIGNTKTIGSKLIRNFGSDVNGDWRLAVYGFVALLVCVLVFDLSVFLHVHSGALYSTNSTDDAALQSIDRDTLKNTLDTYTAKQSRFDDLKANPPQLADPSL